MKSEIIISEALHTLKDFLTKLFQFESADLDFGIYKILHYKKAEVEEFINKLLTEKVREQLNILASAENEKLNVQVQELEKSINISKYLEAVKKNDAGRIAIYEEDFETDIKHYKSLKSQLEHQISTNNAEPLIYNHLTIFFSRYYDKGDFVSKRRYGKSEKYVVPYNGEEIYFHWANADQYYIKSSELFRKYSFKVPSSTGHWNVHFKLRELQEENGNTKSENNKYFVISDNPVETAEDEVNIFFEYRALTNGEKDNKGKTQEELNDYAIPIITKSLTKHFVLAELNKPAGDKTKLTRELNRYTARNKYDFFIHKDLKGFLNRELDFYIKSELLKLDDLTVFDTVTHYEKIKLQLNIVKTFKKIASTIIDFISQVEDFQKKLWEKKKFVISTDYVITLDKLAAFTTDEFANEILGEVLKNEKQLEEWNNLFGNEIAGNFVSLCLGVEEKDATKTLRPEAFPKLPIDTTNFSEEFKWKLICKISEKKNLDEVCDGVVFHSDNYHALQLIQEKYLDSIQSVYIDPPYNTDASAILYKNDYKDSSWLSMMHARLESSYDLLKDDGIICVAIDDEEVTGTRFILNQLFLKQAGIATVRSNPAGRKTKGKFAPAHEYALFYGKTEKSIPDSLDITVSRLKRYPKEDDKGRFAWANFIRSGNNDKREDRPKLYYPIFVDSDDNIRVPEFEWDDENQEYILLEQPQNNETIVYPILKNGSSVIEKNWQRGHVRIKKELDEFRIRRTELGEVSIDFKTRLDEDSLPITWWDDKKYASANYGAAELKRLFGIKPFDFPKAQKLVLDCLKASGAKEESSIILDFFPGSGTTFHSVQVLNQEDEGNRKCILCEQGNYVYSIIIPRIKKVAYSFDWKTGQPQNQNGLGIFLKYQRLEQYEEALENIAFNPGINTAQGALQFNDYIPKYFLHFETSESNTFLNLDAFKNPLNYSLKVFDNYNYTEQVVDVIETFNYLIGLHVSGFKQTEHQNRKYIFVTGNDRQNRKIVAVWRDANELDFAADRDFIRETLKEMSYDVLYVNHQCAIEGAVMIEEVFKNRMTKT
ncbi:MAG: adenine specific DNA methylase [Prolixibacteraceae bacterium]|nr:MAG: adenine specific DNA methylase [Prolixibacteraceae bacterium]